MASLWSLVCLIRLCCLCSAHLMFVSVKKFPSLTLQHSQLRMDTDSGCNTLSAASGQIQKTLSAACRQTQKNTQLLLGKHKKTLSVASRQTQKHSQLILGKHKKHSQLLSGKRKKHSQLLPGKHKNILSCFWANTKTISAASRQTQKTFSAAVSTLSSCPFYSFPLSQAVLFCPDRRCNPLPFLDTSFHPSKGQVVIDGLHRKNFLFSRKPSYEQVALANLKLWRLHFFSLLVTQPAVAWPDQASRAWRLYKWS